MSNKYQKEIEEILKQAGGLAPVGRPPTPRDGFWGLIRGYIGRFLGGKGWAITAGRVMLAAVVLLLGALILRVGFLAWAGLLLFIVGYGMFFIKPRSSSEKRWRGQPLEGVGESWWDRLRRKFK